MQDELVTREALFGWTERCEAVEKAGFRYRRERRYTVRLHGTLRLCGCGVRGAWRGGVAGRGSGWLGGWRERAGT